MSDSGACCSGCAEKKVKIARKNATIARKEIELARKESKIAALEEEVKTLKLQALIQKQNVQNGLLHHASIANCRALLERVAQQYVKDHEKFKKNKPANECCDTKLNKDFKLARIFDHMHSSKCNQRDIMWDSLSAEVKELKKGDAQALYSNLSHRIHCTFVAAPGSILLIPECLSPLEKKLLYRIFSCYQYKVKVVTESDTVRELEDFEMWTPPNSGISTRSSNSSTTAQTTSITVPFPDLDAAAGDPPSTALPAEAIGKKRAPGKATGEPKSKKLRTQAHATAVNCSFFLAGRCKFGNRCRYSHNRGNGGK